MERRDVLRRLVQTGALAMVGGVAGSCTARAAEDRTPSQAEGPFYPVDKPRDLDANLLRFRGRDGLAGGEALGLSGRVLDTDGRPMKAAKVEIWQADHLGVYNHPRAPRRDDFDSRFQGYGEALTDGDGRYRFLTIVPVPYTGRPPHIHVKIKSSGRELLTTQLYIKGHPENGRDGLFSSFLFPSKDQLLMDLRLAQLAEGLKGKATTFNFVV